MITSEQIFISAISGILGYGLGATSKPIQEYFDLIKDIRRCFIQFANCYGTLAQTQLNFAASEKYREFSGRLSSFPHLKLYYLYLFLNLIPNKERLSEASRLFIRLSNTICTDDFESMHRIEKRIRSCLAMEPRDD